LIYLNVKLLRVRFRSSFEGKLATFTSKHRNLKISNRRRFLSFMVVNKILTRSTSSCILLTDVTKKFTIILKKNLAKKFYQSKQPILKPKSFNANKYNTKYKSNTLTFVTDLNLLPTTFAWIKIKFSTKRSKIHFNNLNSTMSKNNSFVSQINNSLNTVSFSFNYFLQLIVNKLTVSLSLKSLILTLGINHLLSIKTSSLYKNNICTSFSLRSHSPLKYYSYLATKPMITKVDGITKNFSRLKLHHVRLPYTLSYHKIKRSYKRHRYFARVLNRKLIKTRIKFKQSKKILLKPALLYSNTVLIRNSATDLNSVNRQVQDSNYVTKSKLFNSHNNPTHTPKLLTNLEVLKTCLGWSNYSSSNFFARNNILAFSKKQTALANNVWPLISNRNKFSIKNLTTTTHCTFSKNMGQWFNKTAIDFIEHCSGLRTLLYVYFTLTFSLNHYFIMLYNRWALRLRYFSRRLGHRFFLKESLHIIHLGLYQRDSHIIISWLKSLILRISFWKTKIILRFIRQLFTYLMEGKFSALNVKGFKVKLKGKISAAGNSRKRSIFLRYGQNSHSSVSLRCLYSRDTVETFTGVLGLQVWVFYKC